MATKSIGERFWSKVDKSPASGSCWVWKSSIHHKGYGQFRYNGGMKSSHRVAYELSFGKIPTGMSVLHKCDNPICVNPEHLFCGTHTDNMRDMCRKGRHSRKKPMARMTASEVIECRRLYALGKATVKDLSKRFSLTFSGMYSVVFGTTWRELPPWESFTNNAPSPTPPAQGKEQK